ncbi:ParA family protein [Streptomyces sp. NBC_00481]|uniref:KGGVGR-motif variant AAA ATPase n=1 Tax=unclassified Streptomyces TaxID=2593676 RepID=UPI002DD9C13B|nr:MULTISPECIES: AAA family ATPase [unclassified Streptomyces]WRY97862.1 ParA family protein [Streptomyces sp. NBC_00481]
MNLLPALVRFDDARPRALAIAYDVAAAGMDVLLVRDVLGRFAVVVDDREQAVRADRVSAWSERMTADLQRYAADRPLLLASGLFSADDLLGSERARPDPLRPPADGHGSVRILDNTVVGEDWAQVSTPTVETDGSRTHRTALYGFKGGVGRTTATAVLARHLADEGHVVLVVDLDLESPGAGPLLAAGALLPRHGIVDQLVESAVHNADGLELVAPTGYGPRTGRGELWVAPARGRDTENLPYSYVDKLNRVYADIPGMDFADRLAAAVRACEDAVAHESESGRRPDVVLLDSRAGIHDIAAVTISRLCDLALLFGADNRQTWGGYGDLFAAWRSSGQARAIREKLRMVASMVPDAPQRPMGAYLESFREHSWECFSVLYDDDVPETGRLVPGAFSPSLEDDSAPHHPIPILFEPGLVGLDADSAPGWQDRAFVQAAYRDFLTTAALLITADPQNDEGPR